MRSEEIHISYITLNQPEARMKTLYSYLSREEKERAGRIIRKEEWEQWCAGRGTLRELLGSYLAVSPSELEIDYGESGKPRLVSLDRAGSSLHFSFSRSQSCGIVSFSRNIPTGIDLESLGPRKYDLMAERYLTPREHAVYKNSQVKDKARVFCTFWTRKEALLKARGTGINLPLDRFETFSPGELGFNSWDSEVLPGWSLISFPERAGFISALAVQGCPCKIILTG